MGRVARNLHPSTRIGTSTGKMVGERRLQICCPVAIQPRRDVHGTTTALPNDHECALGTGAIGDNYVDVLMATRLSYPTETGSIKPIKGYLGADHPCGQTNMPTIRSMGRSFVGP